MAGEWIFYKLVDKVPVPCKINELRESFSIEERQVARATIGNILVSTVFLGMNYTLDPSRPEFFETMVFQQVENSTKPSHLGGGEHYCTRYASWIEAEKMHYYICYLVKKYGEDFVEHI